MSTYPDEKSDDGIRPMKQPNKEGSPSAEAVEERPSPKGNGGETAAAWTLRRDTASIGLARVRRAARRSKSVRFTALLHHITVVYEEDFGCFSYGFRPGRGQHDALDALHVGILRKRVNWVLDADIRGFFDAMSHSWILRFLEHRIADKRILRLIAKWLKVGIIEDGRVTRSQGGAPQGAVITPLTQKVTCVAWRLATFGARSRPTAVS
jgi:hypothetical protein